MARKRMIDPAIWGSEDFSKLSLLAKLVFIGLFSNADDEGRGRGKAAYVKSTVFPYDDELTTIKIDEALDEIANKMSITFYMYDENEYYILDNWNEWQKIDKPTPSKIPTFSEHSTRIRRTLDERSTNARRGLDEDSTINRRTLDEDSCLIEKNRIESKGIESKGKEGGPGGRSKVLTSDLLSEYSFSETASNKILEWLKYKTERKEPYKTTGFKSLLTEISNKIEKYGEQPVIETINISMANNWKGIIWDKLKQNTSVNGNSFLDENI